MIYSIYLHKEIAETLMCYGDLSEVVNRILNLAEEGAYDIIDLPSCQPRDGATRYNIDVTSEYYNSLVATFPANSARISLRRLLYWFVEQEMYDQLEWVPNAAYESSDKKRILKKLSKARSDLSKLTRILNSDEERYLTVIIDHIENLEEIIQNGR